MPSQGRILFCVDMGTTRTRVWITEGEKVWTCRSGDFGVRNVAGGESRAWLAGQLKNLLALTYREAQALGLAVYPSAVLAAGMITSDQGLCEVPHLQAPVGKIELGQQLHMESFSIDNDVSLPLLLVRGVRTGALVDSVDGALQMDLMRGEETLCLGLIQSGILQPGTALLNLGSHWKWIWTDAQKRIARSRTTLTGEMIHVVQANTLIASALPQEAPKTLDPAWVQYGFDEAGQSGLGRALFCVRLLHMQRQGTNEERLSFLYGAFLQGELTYLDASLGEKTKELLLVGSPALVEVWQDYAEAAGISTTILTETEREQAYIHGLQSLYESFMERRQRIN